MALREALPSLVRSSPYWPVVRHRLLRRLLAGFALSYVGEGMSLLAVSWLAIQLAPQRSTGVWVAAAVAAYTLPGALGSVLFGRLLSGRSGAQLAAWDAVLRAVVLAVIPIVYLAGALGIGLYTVLLGLSSPVGGLIWAPFPATTMALLQRSTDGTMRAPVLAAYAAIVTLSVPLGTIAGGPLITGLGAQSTILVSAVLTLIFGATAAGIAILGAYRSKRSGREPAQSTSA